jgi:hypothetical protein
MGMLTLYTTMQRLGKYRCKSITVTLGDGSGMTVRRSNCSFHYNIHLLYSASNDLKKSSAQATTPDEYWAGAYCRTDDCSFHGDETCYNTKGCSPATKLLMFSHFNGLYEEEGEQSLL